MKAFDDDEQITLDMNKPDMVADYLGRCAREMLEHDDEHVKASGLWLKSEVVGFTAALADAKRQNESLGVQLNAAANVYAHLLAMMLASCSHDKVEIVQAAKKIATGFLAAFVGTLGTLTNLDILKEGQKQDQEEMPNYVPKEFRGTVH